MFILLHRDYIIPWDTPPAFYSWAEWVFISSVRNILRISSHATHKLMGMTHICSALINRNRTFQKGHRGRGSDSLLLPHHQFNYSSQVNNCTNTFKGKDIKSPLVLKENKLQAMHFPLKIVGCFKSVASCMSYLEMSGSFLSYLVLSNQSLGPCIMFSLLLRSAKCVGDYVLSLLYIVNMVH